MKIKDSFEKVKSFMSKKFSKVEKQIEKEWWELQKIEEKIQGQKKSSFWVESTKWTSNDMFKFWLIWLIVVMLGFFWYKVLNVIFLIVAAYIVSAIVESLISWLQAHKISRWLSIFLSYFIFVLVLILLFVIILPFIVNQFSGLLSLLLWQLSSLESSIADNWVYETIMNMERLPEWIKNYILENLVWSGVLSQLQSAIQENLKEIISWWSMAASKIGLLLVNFVSGFAGFVANFLLFITLAILFSIEKDQVSNFLAKIWGKKNFELNRLKIEKVYKKLAIWLKARLFVSLFLTIAMWLWLLIMQWCGVVMPNKLWIAVLTWLLDIIPYIGPILTGILLFITWALYNSFWVAVIAVLILWLINVFQNNILTPLLMNKSLWVSCVLIFISMLIWWLIMWFFGVLLAVPIAVIISILSQDRTKLEQVEEDNPLDRIFKKKEKK